MKKLTETQGKILNFIENYIEKNKIPPTFEEIAKNFNYKSKNAVNTHLKALEHKGVIKRIQNKARSITLLEKREKEKYLIPIVGTIAAGAPILAEENIAEYLDLYKIFYSNAELFALRVKGESMKKAGIMDGDLVIVKKQPIIENGEIGVAIIDNEATVKRIFFKNGKIILHPENDEMKDIIIYPQKNEFYIAGKVIGVVRRL